MKLLYPIIDDHKECGNCHIIKPVSEYTLRKNPNGSYSPCTQCKDCKTKYAQKLRRSQGIGVSKRYPVINDHKKCTACNENKHISEYLFKKEGYMIAKCASCMIKYHEDRRRERGVKKRIMHPIINGIKKCSKCCIDKPVIEYLKGMHHCIDCNKQRIIIYRNRRVDYINEKGRLYYHNVYKEKHRVTCKLYYEKSKEELSDVYIKTRLSDHSDIRPKDIPSHLIEIERKRIKLIRTIKQLNLNK